MPILTPTRKKAASPGMQPAGASALEKDIIIGFCGGTASACRLAVPTVFSNDGFRGLREMFLESDKRFWVYSSGNTEIYDGQAVWAALACMINYGLGAVGLFATDKRNIAKAGLKFTETGWVPKHFMMVDSRRVGHVAFDDNLPNDNAIDVSYSLSIKADGYALGIAPGTVLMPKQDNAIDPESHAYFVTKYGEFYTQNIKPIPEI